MEISRTTPGYYTQSPSFYNSLRIRLICHHNFYTV